MSSDHFSPWRERQGESGFAWAGWARPSKRRTCPSESSPAPGQRYHPAVGAQAAATLAEMFPDRFWLAVVRGSVHELTIAVATKEHAGEQIGPTLGGPQGRPSLVARSDGPRSFPRLEVDDRVPVARHQLTIQDAPPHIGRVIENPSDLLSAPRLSVCSEHPGTVELCGDAALRHSTLRVPRENRPHHLGFGALRSHRFACPGWGRSRTAASPTAVPWSVRGSGWRGHSRP